MSISRTEILLIESIFFALCWLINDYIALILTIALTAIIAASLFISAASESIERSRVPKSFFWTLFWSIFPPVIIGLIYHFVIEGEYAWMQGI
jgi:hypothetical protein